MGNPHFRRQNRRSSRNRIPARVLTPLPRILIVCQGEKTEPNFFRSFHVADVEIVHGNGDPSQVVEFAKLEFERNRSRDEVWCVFDRDDFPQFDAAIQRIESFQQLGMPFRAAWSNVCFELWFVLHFEYLQSALDRERYSSKLADYLQSPYVKNDFTIRDRLQRFEETALRNAANLWQMHDDRGEILPSRRCPATTVHKLVEVLRLAQLR